MELQENFEFDGEESQNVYTDKTPPLILKEAPMSEAIGEEVSAPINEYIFRIDEENMLLNDVEVNPNVNKYKDQASVLKYVTIVPIEPELKYFIDCYFEGTLPNQWKELPEIQETSHKSHIEEVAEMKSLDTVINRLKEKKNVIKRFFERRFSALKRSTKEEKEKQVNCNEKILFYQSLIEERVGQIKELTGKVKFYDQLESEIMTQTKELLADFQDRKMSILEAHFKIRQNLDQIMTYARKQKQKIDRKLNQQWRYFGKEQLYYDRDNVEILQCYIMSLIPELQKEVSKIGELKLSTK